MTDNLAALKKLREPFTPEEINTLPKPYTKDSPKGQCKDCGGYHGLPAAHLPYVGHAALTGRLLNVDPEWAWEPLSLGPDGLPVFDRNGGLWIRLTVAGMTRLGYGDAQGKGGGNAIKEAIGDALRNAAMRFGAALDLWHKGDALERDEPVRDWLTEAELADTADATLAIWQEARMAKADMTTILDPIAELGKTRRDAETRDPAEPTPEEYAALKVNEEAAK